MRRVGNGQMAVRTGAGGGLDQSGLASLAVLEGEVVAGAAAVHLSPLWTVLFSRFLLHEKLNRAGWR